MDNNTLNLIVSFLGGGVVVAILDGIRINKAEKRSRRLATLSEQLQNLYGPLYFFTSQNQRLFDLNDSILKAYQKEYVEEKWSKDEQTQKNLKENTTTTLDLANAYVALATENNDKIIEILKNNYSFIDTDDVDVFQQFVVDYTRLKTERDEKGRLITPDAIYWYIGNISFMRPEFIKKVRTKFNSIKYEIKSLTK